MRHYFCSAFGAVNFIEDSMQARPDDLQSCSTCLTYSSLVGFCAIFCWPSLPGSQQFISPLSKDWPICFALHHAVSVRTKLSIFVTCPNCAPSKLTFWKSAAVRSASRKSTVERSQLGNQVLSRFGRFSQVRALERKASSIRSQTYRSCMPSSVFSCSISSPGVGISGLTRAAGTGVGVCGIGLVPCSLGAGSGLLSAAVSLADLAFRSCHSTESNKSLNASRSVTRGRTRRASWLACSPYSVDLKKGLSLTCARRPPNATFR